MREFDITSYIEIKRNLKGIKQGKLAESIGINESNYSTKVSRKSFSFEEIVRLLEILDIKWVEVKCLIDGNDIAEIITNLEAVKDDFEKNTKGFKDLEKILSNEVILEEIDEDKKCYLGYLMIDVASKNRPIWIAEEYLDKIFINNVRIDLNVMMGIFYGCFFGYVTNYDIYFKPNYKYFPRMLEYLFRIYTEEEILIILRKIDEKTVISKNIYVAMSEVHESIKKYINEDEWIEKRREGYKNVIYVISKIIEAQSLGLVLKYEFEKFKLKIEYINNINDSKNN